VLPSVKYVSDIIWNISDIENIKITTNVISRKSLFSPVVTESIIFIAIFLKMGISIIAIVIVLTRMFDSIKKVPLIWSIVRKFSSIIPFIKSATNVVIVYNPTKIIDTDNLPLYVIKTPITMTMKEKIVFIEL